MSPTLISIVMPVYNVEKYLGECIDSIIAQSYPHWELLSVNDGSTDGSLAILENYAARDSRIRVINQPNGGYGKAMNAGLNAAQGDYVGIVESDDVIDPAMYEKLLNLIETHQADVVKGGYQYFWDVTNQPRHYEAGGRCPAELLDRPLCPIEHPDCYRIPLYIWAGLYRRSWLEQWKIRVHETPGASYQDNGFWFQTLTLAQRAVWVNDVYYHYRQSNANSSIHKKGDYDLPLLEFDYIERTLQQKAPEQWERARAAFATSWWAAMYYTYKRIAPQHHEAFLKELSVRMQPWLDSQLLRPEHKLNYREGKFLIQMTKALDYSPEQRARSVKRAECVIDIKQRIKKLLHRA